MVLKPKSGLSSVVATALLLVVAVIAVVSLSSWMGIYSSSTYVDVEKKATDIDSIEIISIFNDKVYIKNSETNNISLNSIELGGFECSGFDNLTPGINIIDISSCLNVTGPQEIVLVSEKGVTEKEVYLKNEIEVPIQKYDSFTKLMLHCEDENDDSNSAHTVNFNGDARIDSSQSKFGSSSCYFDGSGDFLTIPFNSDFALGGQDFTIDFWMRPESSLTIGDFFLIKGTNPMDFIAYSYPGQNSANFYINNGQYIGSQYNNAYPSVNTWNHFAFVRDGSNWRVFIDGVQTNFGSSSSSVITSTSNIIYITSTRYYRGHIDEYRVTVGTARWTSAFTPPTQPYE